MANIESTNENNTFNVFNTSDALQKYVDETKAIKDETQKIKDNALTDITEAKNEAITGDKNQSSISSSNIEMAKNKAIKEAQDSIQNQLNDSLDEISNMASYVTSSITSAGFVWDNTNYKIPNPSNALTSDWISITYGNGVYVALSYDGYVSTSTDAIEWATPVQPEAFKNSNWLGGNAFIDLWAGCKYGAEKFVAISARGYVSTSTDGVNWTNAEKVDALESKYNVDSNWNCLVYGKNRFVTLAFCDRKLLYAYSEDGLNWTYDEYEDKYKEIIFSDGQVLSGYCDIAGYMDDYYFYLEGSMYTICMHFRSATEIEFSIGDYNKSGYGGIVVYPLKTSTNGILFITSDGRIFTSKYEDLSYGKYTAPTQNYALYNAISATNNNRITDITENTSDNTVIALTSNGRVVTSSESAAYGALKEKANKSEIPTDDHINELIEAALKKNNLIAGTEE